MYECELRSNASVCEFIDSCENSPIFQHKTYLYDFDIFCLDELNRIHWSLDF